MKHMLNWLELSIRSETGTMFEWNLQLCSWSQYSTRPSMTWPLSETPSSARSSASPLALLTWWNDCLKALLLMYFHYIHQHLRVLSCIVCRVFPLCPPTSKGLQPSSYWFPLSRLVCFQQALPFYPLYLFWSHCMDVDEVLKSLIKFPTHFGPG